MTTGLGCDGDSVSITAATLPSVEEVVARLNSRSAEGAPPQSRACLRSRRRFHEVLVSGGRGESSIRSFLSSRARFPTRRSRRKATGPQWAPIPIRASRSQLTRWLDRLSPKALAVIACGTCATYGGIHAMQGNPTGAMGLADYLGWGWRSKAGLPIINVPGCPVQPDNMMETVLYLLYQAAGLGADDPARRPTAPDVAVRKDRPRRLRSRRLLRAG